MTPRSRRFFRAQFRLLLALNLLESAEERLELAERTGRRRNLRRARRDVTRLRRTIESRRSEVVEWMPQSLREEELLARVRPLLGPEAASAPAAAALGSGVSGLLAGWLLAAGATAGWAVTAFEVASHGIGDRPSLIVAEAVAILLSPFAIALFGRR